MDKLKLHSPNITEANIEKIAELFPSCIVEARDDKGELTRKIDFDQLRQELSNSIVDGPQERYRLDWPGKREALLAANAPIAKTLRPCREESVNFETTQNLFIEGDNLDALKLLQETFLGKVKLIYIDPPYNTGNDFIYDDDFSVSSEEYILKSNQRDDERNRLIATTITNGRFHSDWLSMMYSRLRLSRNLLKEDGVIFISIDDGEVHNLRKICDEIYGESNFQANIAWQKRYTRSNNTVDFTTVIEHILVYSKSDAFEVNLLPRTDEADARYSNPDNDPRGVWKGASFLNPATPRQRPNLCYPITNPKTGTIRNPTSNAWRRSNEEFLKLAADRRLYWGPNGDSEVPTIKMFLSEARGMTPINFWQHEYAGNTDLGTKELGGLFGRKVFENPKPALLLKRVLEHSLNENDIVLDFFAGSASTADAVMQKNAEHGNNHRFILIQLPEVCAEDSEAFKAGYKTIAEISKERIRRAGKKIKEENATTTANLDTGFRVLKIDSSNVKDIYYTPDTISQDELALQIDHIKSDRTDEDLLFQVMLDWGVDLALSIEAQNIKNKRVYFVDNTAIVACFEPDIGETLIKELAQHKPLRVVFRDTSYASDSMKINIREIFKLLSPETEIKEI
jgi:adenine-specific DNA-methyltransferase